MTGVKRTHCKNGHPQTEENIFFQKSDGRIKRGCRLCRKYRLALRRKQAGRYARTISMTCKNGHAKTGNPANTTHNKKGYFICRECQREGKRRWRARRRAAGLKYL